MWAAAGFIFHLHQVSLKPAAAQTLRLDLASGMDSGTESEAPGEKEPRV